MKGNETLIIVMAMLALISCQGKNPAYKNDNSFHIVNAAINLKDIESLDSLTIDGGLKGVNWDKSEIYVDSTPSPPGQLLTKIINPLTGKVKTSIVFPKGDSQSPNHFTGASFIENVEDQYYVIDHLYKIVTYDSGFHYLFTSMFYNPRIFVDFFTYDHNIYFLFGRSTNLRANFRYNLELYKLISGRRPVMIKCLYESFHESPYPRNGDKYYYIIFFRSSIWGFEKEGDIFYSDNRKNTYLRYNIRGRRQEIFKLPYLKARIYNQNEADRAANYKNLNRKVRGLKTIIVPAVDPTFHQGLCDVGKGKIGLVTDIDLTNFSFRLDIFDTFNSQYRYSMRLPFGEGFLRRTSSQNLGYLQSYINVDLGVYVWSDLRADQSDVAVKITRFKLADASDGG